MIAFVVNFFVRAFAASSAMIMHIAIAKVLSPEEAGFFYTSFTLVTLISVVSRLGLDEVVLRMISTAHSAYSKNRINSIYKTAVTNVIVCSFIGMVAVGMLGLACYLWGRHELGLTFLYMSPSVIFVSIYFIHAQMLQGRSETIKSTIVLGFISQLFFSLLIIIFPLEKSYSTAIYFDFSTLLSMIVGRKFWAYVTYFKWKEVDKINMWDSCIPLWIVAILQQVTMWGGQLIAAFLVSSTDIAALNLFQRLTSILQFFLLLASLIYSPKIASMYANGEKCNLQKTVNKIVLFLSITSFIILFIGVLTSYNIISYFFGDDYSSKNKVFLILLLGQALNTCMGLSVFILTMCSQEKELKSIICRTFPIVLLVNLVLTWKFGILGVAFSSTISLFLQNILCVFSVKKNVGLCYFYFMRYFK